MKADQSLFVLDLNELGGAIVRIWYWSITIKTYNLNQLTAKVHNPSLNIDKLTYPLGRRICMESKLVTGQNNARQSLVTFLHDSGWTDVIST